jgi:hypothetical protein
MWRLRRRSPASVLPVARDALGQRRQEDDGRAVLVVRETGMSSNPRNRRSTANQRGTAIL